MNNVSIIDQTGRFLDSGRRSCEMNDECRMVESLQASPSATTRHVAQSS